MSEVSILGMLRPTIKKRVATELNKVLKPSHFLATLAEIMKRVLDSNDKIITCLSNERTEISKEEVSQLLLNLDMQSHPKLLEIFINHKYQPTAELLIAVSELYNLDLALTGHLIETKIGNTNLFARKLPWELVCDNIFSEGLLNGHEPKVFSDSEIESPLFASWVSNPFGKKRFSHAIIHIKNPDKPGSFHTASLLIYDHMGKKCAHLLSTSPQTMLEDRLKRLGCVFSTSTLRASSPHNFSELAVLLTFFQTLKLAIEWRQPYQSMQEAVDSELSEASKDTFTTLFPEENLMKIVQELRKNSAESIVEDLLKKDSQRPEGTPSIFERMRIHNIEQIDGVDVVEAVREFLESYDLTTNQQDAAILILFVIAIATGQVAHIKLLKMLGAAGACAICVAQVGTQIIFSPENSGTSSTLQA